MYPQVICHIMGSVDGRLLTDRWTEPFNGKSKAELTAVYAAVGRRLNTDAWMFGKNTLREGFFPGKFHTQDTTPPARPVPYVAGRTSPRLFVVADPEADILYESSAVRGDSIVTICPKQPRLSIWSISRGRGYPTCSPGQKATISMLQCRRCRKPSVWSRSRFRAGASSTEPSCRQD